MRTNKSMRYLLHAYLFANQAKHIIDLFAYMPLQSNPVGVGQVEQPLTMPRHAFGLCFASSYKSC